ncbi:MAG: hypothetical protein WCI81_02415 [Chlorobiaceae bacterium]
MKAVGAEKNSAIAVKSVRKLIITSSALMIRMSRKTTKEIIRKMGTPFFCTLLCPAPDLLFSRDDGVLLSVFKLVWLSVVVS